LSADRLALRVNTFYIPRGCLGDGCKTYETVCGFGGGWPYAKPDFIVIGTLEVLVEEYRGKA